jgi:APA family basic amino acid/polyamine antiporter
MGAINEYILLCVLGSFSEYGITGMLQACTYVFFAYEGFDSVAAVAQEARAPTARPIAFATIASVVISSLIYIAICTVMVGLVPYQLLDSDDPLSIAM